MTADPHSLFAIFFFGGILVELALLLVFTVKENLMRVWALLLLLPLLYFLGTAYSSGEGDYVTLLISSCVGVLGTTLLFLPEILPVITRYHVLTYTITFWYALAGASPDDTRLPFHTILFVVSLAGAAGALWGHFRPAESGKVVWNLAYAWYLAALAYIGFSQLSGLDLDFFSPSIASPARPGPLEALVYGMAFAYVVASFSMTYLYGLFGYTQVTGSENSNRNNEQMVFLKKLLGAKTLDVTLEQPGVVMVILGAQLALGALNHLFNFMPRFFLINCFVLALPYLITRQLKTQAVPQPSPGIYP